MRTSIAVPFICFSNSSLASLKKKSANGRMSSLHSRNGGMCRAYSFSRWYRSARKRFSAMAVGKSSLVAFCDTHVGFLVPVAVHICTFYIPRHGAASAVPLSEGYLSLQETACRHRFPPQNLAFYFLSVSMRFTHPFCAFMSLASAALRISFMSACVVVASFSSVCCLLPKANRVIG